MAAPDALNAALADRYWIERELGTGGMATVYLARDLRHDRQVALKVLKPELAAVLGADRFVVEIKTTASLQHPHILPLFDSGIAGGFLFYVMPYIAGETIREKLNRETQFGVEEAVRIAREIADALDYAHRHGVIHRDIKPENVLLHDGRAMVMDFGIALALSAAAGGRMTETGLSLGTPHYMSPEQATAEKDLTPRSDLYSLASVLYEMLSGQPPHLGGSAQQIIMKILTDSPRPVSELRRSVPPNVSAAIAKALEKLPADRFDSAKAFSDALANASFTTAATAGWSAGAPAARGARSRRLAPWALAALFAVALGWSLRRSPRGDDPGAVPMRFDLAAPSATYSAPGSGSAVFLTPDGRTLVYRTVGPSGANQLARRPMDDLTPVLIAGTEGVFQHALSPDGKWVAFLADSALKKIPISGGAVSVITSTSQRSIAWGPNNEIILGAVAFETRGLTRVSAAGGALREVSRPDTANGESNQRWPRVLDDGKTVLYTSWPLNGALSKARLGIGDLQSGKSTILDVSGTYPLGFVDGNLIYARPDGPIMAVPIDLRRRRVIGDPVVLIDAADIGSGGASQATLSTNSTLVYKTGS